MFKIAFPWAKLDEERSEREYLKTRTETSEDEIAGNVWISPLLGKYHNSAVMNIILITFSPRASKGVSNVRLG